MRAQEWIDEFARSAQVPAPDDERFAELLELAATAAHSSERVAAPIACYLAGMSSRPLDELRAAADRIGTEPPV